MKRSLDQTSLPALLGGFAAANLLLKGALISLNSAEYTDGILQITLFRELNSIYPPLFAALTTAVGVIVRDLEMAGRIVSILASALTVIPLGLLTARLFGRRAAFFALLFYTASPIALRWSLHAMTDATFGALFLMAVWFFVTAWLRYDAPADEFDMAAVGNEPVGKSAPRAPSPAAATVLGIVFAVLATLTRYQGVLLLPVGFFFLNYDWHRRRRVPVALNLAHALWALPVLWAVYAGFIHGGQFAERTTPDLSITLLNYWFHFESWLIHLPYFFTPLMALLMAGGLFLTRREHPGGLFYLALALALSLATIVLQTLFSSFQSRYMLPVLLLLLPFAGHAAAALEDRARGRVWPERLHAALLVAVLLYGIGFGVVAVSLQRHAFGDIKTASRFAAPLQTGGTIYTNEVYRPGMDGIKVRFWSGREVKLLTPEMIHTPGALTGEDLIIWSSAYGGYDGYQYVMTRLMQDHGFFPAKEFNSVIVPMLPDIMEMPGTSQNPIALAFRYHPQEFFTVVFAKRPEGQNGPYTLEAPTPSP